MLLFDSHSHLNDEKFDEDREKVIKEVVDNGATRFVTAGYDVRSSEDAVKLANKYDFIYAICGISPQEVPDNIKEIDNEVNKIKELAIKNNKVKAIGEIGLDYYWVSDNKQLQKELFIKQINLANELNLPIQIHTREAVMDTLEILKTHIVKNKGIFHCCPQNRELIKEGLKLGFYISFAGPITFKNSKNAEEMINLVPNDRLLIETDSPYLAPEPVRGTRNIPSNVKYVAQKVAKVKGLSIEDVGKITYENANRILKIEK